MPFEISDPRGVGSDRFHGYDKADYSKVQQSFVARDLKENPHVWRKEQTSNLPNTSWRFTDRNSSTVSSINVPPTSFGLDRNGAGMGRIQSESSLFSCSLSETYSRTSRLSSYDHAFTQYAGIDNKEDEHTESLEEIEAQTIAYLLPDEDDLFSGVTDELGFKTNLVGSETLDEFDIFSSGGGMELDGDNIDVAAPHREGILKSIGIKSESFQKPQTAIGARECMENKTFKGSCRAPNTFQSQVKVACASNPYAFDGSCQSRNQMNYGFGSLEKKCCPLHENPYGLNKPNLYHPSSPVKWQNSPLSNHVVQVHHHARLPGYRNSSFIAKNMSLPLQHYHLESTQPVGGFNRDMRITYMPGFPCFSPFNSFENVSPNVFSHGGGSYIEMSAKAGLCYPQQISHILPGRNPIMSVPTSLNETVRVRRKDVVSSQADRKQFELDIVRILQGDDCRTTLMIKNIPNKYTSKMLLASIDEHHQGTYDFIYLPIDFKNKCNVGYAFVNMIDPLCIVPFHKSFNGKKWEKFNSQKVASIAYARIQGKAALVHHFQNSSLMNEDKRCRPILFHTDGPNAGDQEPFPMGSNIRSRSGRGNPSTNASGEDICNETDSSSSSTKD